MKDRLWITVVALVALLSLCPLGSARAATGTLKGSFFYKDPVTGAEQVLTNGFLYLHNASNPPPMEKFLVQADYILAISPASPFSVSVPEGSYYIRLLQRKGTTGQFGPPMEGDYTWMQQIPIKITAGATLDLGKKYAVPFAYTPIIVTGTIKTATGTPLQSRYVRAQTEPCLVPINCTDSGCQQYGNQCGPAKYLALAPTGAGGTYTLYLADAGTYYLYASTCLVPGHNANDVTRCEYSAAPGPITVNRGDKLTVDIVAN